MIIQDRDNELKFIEMLDSNGITLLNARVGTGGLFKSKLIIERNHMNGRKVLVLETVNSFKEMVYKESGDFRNYRNELSLLNKNNATEKLKELRESENIEDTFIFINDIEFFWNRQGGLRRVSYSENELTKDFINTLLHFKKNHNTILLRVSDIDFLKRGKLAELLKYESIIINYHKI